MVNKEEGASLPDFKALGHQVAGPSRELETFPAPERVTEVTFTSQELTCGCPITHQPDFYTTTIFYQPTTLCLESKSLKLYLWSFREETMFAESLASRIVGDVSAATKASYCRVTLKQQVRGGVSLEVVAENGSRGE